MKHLAILLLVLLPLALTAQTLKPIHNTLQDASLQFHSEQPSATTVTTPMGQFTRLSLSPCGSTHEIGAPQLPVYRQHIEIPVCGDIEVIAIPTDSVVVSLSDLGATRPIIPVQPKRRKSDTTTHPFAYNAEAYATTRISQPIVSIVPIGIARSRQLARIEISPVTYNPSQGTITVYSDIDITLRYKDVDADATQHLSLYSTPSYPAPTNTIALTTGKAVKGITHHAPMRYIIISAPMFRGHLDQLVEWKRQQGYLAEIYYTDNPAVGKTIASIRAFLKQQYTAATHSNPAPDYVLLVGDIDQLPSFRTRITDNGITGGTAHITDLYYFTWTDDVVPDCLYGRLSANSIEELQPQIDKTLYYEKYDFSDPSYLATSILVAGYDAKQPDDFAYTISDPAMDYVASRFITPANGFATTYYYKNDVNIVPRGATVAGNCQDASTATNLRRLYAQGFGWINYSAHGVERGWTAPQFNTTQVPAMNNYGKPSIMIGNCCLTNHFNTQTCFGEALLRKGDLSGAVAYIGAINSTFWDDDFFWTVGYRASITPDMHANGAIYDNSHLGMYDRLFHLENEPFADHYVSMGSMIYAGNMAVDEDGYDDYTQYYWEIYCLMGDPSLMPWLGLAQPLTLNYAQPVSRSIGTVVVSTESNAYVVLRSSADGTILDATYADADGNASLTFNSAVVDTLLHISAIAQGHIPAFGTVALSNDENIRLGISNVQTFNLRAGDTADMSFTLSNIGYDTLRFINYLLRATPTMLTPLHSNEYIHKLPPHTSIGQEHVCRSLVSSSLPDGAVVPATLQFISDTIVASIALQLHIQAPSLAVKSIATQGIVAANKTIDLYVTLINRGHATAHAFTCTIAQDYGLATLLSQPQQVGILQQDSVVTLHFTLAIDSLCRYLNELPLTLIADFGSHTVSMPLAITFFSDDFESADFQTLDWQNDSEYPWIVTNSTAKHGTHSARSARGLPDFKSSTLSLTFVSHDSADSLSFYYRTATETDNDIFRVMLDNDTIVYASGNDPLWHKVEMPVDSGQHTLLFVYSKDQSRSIDSDCVWIDGLIIPDTTTAFFTYSSDSVCIGSPYTFYNHEVGTAEAGTFAYSHREADTTHLLRLTVMPAPNVRIASSDTAALPGQQVILTATGATTYRWNNGDTTATILIVPDSTTNYSVTGTRFGCIGTDSIVVGTRPLALRTITTPQSVSIYPNPTHGTATIHAEQMQHIAVFDIYGRSVISLTPHASTALIDLSQQPNGIYIIHTTLRNAVVTRKITKQ